MNLIDTAITWAIGIANGDHGYNQSARTGPDYDCSSLCAAAYRAAGLTQLSPDLYTGNMKSGFESCGFKSIAYSSTTILNPGDVIFAHKQGMHHAVLFIGDGMIVQASQDERGQYSGGAPGDQTGNEINISSMNRSKGWQWILRWPECFSELYGNGASMDYNSIVNTVDGITGDPQYRSTTGITVYSDVISGAPNDRHDMTIREICYYTDKLGFTTEESQIRISAINYTTLLGNLYDRFANYYPDGYEVDVTALGGNGEHIMEFFLKKGLNPAAGAGITGAIDVLSGLTSFDTSRFVNGHTGLCGWEGSYSTAMRLQVQDWQTNLTGQLEYLWGDLASHYHAVLQIIANVPISENGARQAANRFMISYRTHDRVQSVDEELNNASRAQKQASVVYKCLKITPQESEGTSYTTPTQVTIPIGGVVNLNTSSPEYYEDNVSYLPTLQSGQTYVLPDPIRQQGGIGSDQPDGGINTEFTSYSYWCDHFNHSSRQYKLAQIWKNRYAMSCSRGAATISGHFLVAVAQTYGTIGDAIQVDLINGESFKAIIADAKSTGDSNYTVWGHRKYYGINIIEWERVKTVRTSNNEVHAITSNSTTAVDSMDLSGWRGQQVVSITNLGRMFDL